MPTYTVRARNGRTYTVKMLKRATAAELEAAVIRQHPEARGPDTSAVRGFALGALKSLDEAATLANEYVPGAEALDRLGQYLGMPSTSAAVAHNEALRAANTRTGFQGAGRIAGDVALTAPLGVAAGGLARGVAGGTRAGQAAATALETQGFKTGLLPTRAAVKEGLAAAPTVVQRLSDLALRGAAGGAMGAATSAATGQDTGMGAAVGALLPTVGSAAFRGVADKILFPFWERVSGQLGVQRAAAIFRNAFNMTIQEAKALARGADADTPFAEVLARAGKNEPTVQALHRMAAEGAGKPVYGALEDAETAANQATLDAMRRGASAGEARAAGMEGKAAANAEYRPAFEDIAARANLGGEVIPGLRGQAGAAEQAAAEQSALARRMAFGSERAETRLGQTDDLGDAFSPEAVNAARGQAGAMGQRAETAAEEAIRLRGEAAAAQQAIADLNSQGITALESRPIAAQIRGLTRQDDVAGDRTLTNALNDLASEIESHGPVIRAGVLDTLYRKAGDRVARFMDNPNDLSGLSKYSGKVLSLVKPMISQAIEGAGGTGYGALKTEYGSAMGEQNRQAFAGTLADIYRGGAGGRTAFKDVVEGATNADLDVVAKGFPQGGPRNWNINEMMGVPGGAQGPSRIPALNKIAGDVGVRNAMAQQADVGQYAAEQLLKAPPNEADIFHRYSPLGLATNLLMGVKTFGAGKAVDFAEMLANSGLTASTQKALVEGLRNGRSVEEMLSTIPLADRAQLARRAQANGMLAARGQAGVSTANVLNTPPRQESEFPPVDPVTGQVLVGVGEYEGQRYPMYGAAAQNRNAFAPVKRR